MAINYGFIGTISEIKEKENFKPYVEYPGDKGTTILYRFNMKCGTDLHTMQIRAFDSKDKRDIVTGKKGSDGKYEKYVVKWDDRNKESVLSQVVDYKKFIVDKNTSGYIGQLERLVKDFADGSVTDEQMKRFNITDLKAAETALAEAKAGRVECITTVDYLKAVKAFVESKPEGKFYVQGEYELSENKGKWYSSLAVQKITKFVDKPDEDVVGSNMSVQMLLTPDSVDETDSKFVVTGYVPVYAGKDDNGKNKYTYVPLSVIKNKSEETKVFCDGLKKKLTYGIDDNKEKCKEMGFVVRLHNGSDRVKLTYDMLTDDQKASVDAGLCELADIEKEMNGSVYGERCTDIEILKLGKGYTASWKDTEFTVAEIIGTKDEAEEDITEEDFDELFSE